MPRTAVAVDPAMWGCRWSQPGPCFAGVPQRHRPEPDWVCLRTGEPRAVTEHECAHCPHWEREEPHPGETQSVPLEPDAWTPSGTSSTGRRP